MHKQDARLQKWQQDRKNRAHVPMISLRHGLQGSKEKSASDAAAPNGPPGRRPANGHAPAHAAGGRGNKPDPRDTRALWEKAGGLSAASVTAATIQKNKGAIAVGKPEGKKIVFGD